MIYTISYSLLAILPIVLIVYFYNGLTKRRNRIENAISSLDAYFIKRSELIPNLIEVVKKYMSFEETTLQKITAMRQMDSHTNPKAEKEAKDALRNLMIQVENYPDLKANNQFRDLQYSMNEVEEQIAAGRRYVATNITLYNDAVKTFPSNLAAGMIGFKEYKWQYASLKEREGINAKELFD